MAGSGHLQSMRVILRNNRNLLRKKGLFKKDKSFLSSRKEYLEAAKGNVDFKTISKSELRALREKVIKNRKADNLKSWLITLVIMIPIFSFGLYISNLLEPSQFRESVKGEIQNNILIEQKLTDDLNEFQFLIEDGDKWIEKRNWNNAIYRFKQAVKLFPSEFEGNYRLALAYSYNCQEKNEDCEIGLRITSRLIEYYPDDPSLLKLKSFFEK